MAGLSALQAQSTAHSRAAVVLAAAVERDVAASAAVVGRSQDDPIAVEVDSACLEHPNFEKVAPVSVAFASSRHTVAFAVVAENVAATSFGREDIHHAPSSAAAAVAHLASQGAAFGAAADPVAALHSSAALARGPVKGTPAADSPSPEGVAAEAAAAEVKVVVELLQLVVLSGFDFGSVSAADRAAPMLDMTPWNLYLYYLHLRQNTGGYGMMAEARRELPPTSSCS